MKITGVGDISFFSGSSASASDIFAWILLFFVCYLYYTSFIFIQIFNTQTYLEVLTLY